MLNLSLLGGTFTSLSRSVHAHVPVGQGVWYALTHRPDKIIGAAPVSGYSSIQGYVPYQHWEESDTKIISNIHSSLRSFRHELLLGNAQDIPIMSQHGSDDDNVPAFHSRRMNQLLLQSGREVQPKYVELKGKGHWFDGVFTTMPLAKFYADIVSVDPEKPILPWKFSVTVANVSDMGSRGGIKVDQLSTPDQYGKISVERRDDQNTWILQTSNILRFHVCPDNLAISPERLIVDSDLLHLPHRDSLRKAWFVRGTDHCWRVSHLRRG